MAWIFREAHRATPPGGTFQWQKLLQATAFGFMAGRNRHLPTFLARLRAWKGRIPFLGGEDTATPAAHPTRTHLEKGLQPTRICSPGYQVSKPGSKSSSPYSSAPFPYKPPPANPAPGFGSSFYLQPHYYQRFASKNSSEN